MSAITVQDKLVQDRLYRYADDIAERREISAERERSAAARRERITFSTKMISRTLGLGIGLCLYLQAVPHVIHFFQAVR